MIIFLILFGISFTFQSSALLKTHTSAAFFPRIVLLIAMGFTLILIIQSIVRKEAVSGAKKLDREKMKRVIGSMGLALLFGFGMIFVGTFVSISLFIVAIMLSWGVRNIAVILLNALIVPILIYLIFTKILLVQLPSGFLM